MSTAQETMQVTIERIKESMPTREHVSSELELTEAKDQIGLNVGYILPHLFKIRISYGNCRPRYAVMFRDSNDRVFIRVEYDGEIIDVYLTPKL